MGIGALSETLPVRCAGSVASPGHWGRGWLHRTDLAELSALAVP